MIAQAALPAALAFIMFSMGLTLVVRDFRQVIAQPRAIAAGLGVQMIALPVMAWGIVLAAPMAPEFAVGLIIVAACPAGITSNLLTHLAGGSTALAVSLTAISSLAATVSVPFVVNLALAHLLGAARPADLPVARMTLGIFLVATLPLLIAMAIRHWRPGLASRMERPAGRLATALFVLIVLGAFASQWTYMMGYALQVLPFVLALNLGLMLLAFLVSRASGFDQQQRIALILVSGLQNGALGIFVAASLLGSETMMAPSILYALAMNVTAIAYIVWVRRAPAQSSRIER